MAPNHILRATMPIRSIASPMAMTRSTILPSALSISQSLRSASTISNPAQKHANPSPATPSAQNLQRPALLRNYAYTLKTGTVESVGRMERTVRVSHRHNIWDKHIGKFYPKETRYLVSDPLNSLREGDVIEFSSGAPKSRHVHHVVERIITPFAVPIEDRPAVMSREQREQERERRWAEKYVRRESRRQGEEVDLVARAAAIVGEEKAKTLSTAQLIHRIHAGQERVGKLKQLVLERTAKRPVKSLKEE
ncbi:Nucleic acid-binding OB-fold [Penicillium sp. IBT 16267x]|nr:Nucleic acid-binding OB-fold [Penicillium sp. IBT 16267x]